MPILSAPTAHSETMLASIIEHWAKARIDSPLQLISRLDDAAKQVITVTGLLQGALIAVVKLGEKPLSYEGLGASVLLLSTIVLAAIVLALPPHDMWAHRIYRDLRCSSSDDELSRHIDERFKLWCGEVSKAVKVKRYVLTSALLTMVIGLALCVVCLMNSLGVETSKRTVESHGRLIVASTASTWSTED